MITAKRSTVRKKGNLFGGEDYLSYLCSRYGCSAVQEWRREGALKGNEV